MRALAYLHKYFWRIICSVIAICLTFIVGVLIWALFDEVSYEYDYALSERLGVHRTAKEGYIYNRETKEKVISDVEFIGEPAE